MTSIIDRAIQKLRREKANGKKHAPRKKALSKIAAEDKAIERDVFALLKKRPALSRRMSIEELGGAVHEGIQRAYEGAGRIVDELEALPSIPTERRGLYKAAKLLRRDLKKGPRLSAANVKVLADIP